MGLEKGHDEAVVPADLSGVTTYCRSLKKKLKRQVKVCDSESSGHFVRW